MGKILKPRQALNKAFLKIKPNREEIERFKAQLIALLNRSNDTESEEFHKNLVSDFLKNTYYSPDHFINTKDRKDLVIHNGKNSKSSVGVILEAKKPTNRHEMMQTGHLNTKAMQELLLYYLRERISDKNLDLRHLVATNIYEWFIFDANSFETLFAQNKKLVKQYEDFTQGRMSGTTTDFFYREIAAPALAEAEGELPYTYFDIRHYEKPLKNDDPRDDRKLIALFKLLSPEHLLKLPFANDSNSLDKRFYEELLHLIGLKETKKGSQKLIQRKPPGERNSGSLLENAIVQLDSLDKISRLKNKSRYGRNEEERLFNVGLELCITWINRILFLKLLEAQLITYHKGDKSYAFLNRKRLANYDDLNGLFFQVLARTHEERNPDIKAAFARVPYLNSSLFQPTDMEHDTLFMSNLRDDKLMPIYAHTVLRDDRGKKLSGERHPLGYLFEFLDAYDFTSEGGEDIQEDNKTLINASVLGLIFEKINGYKDGSFFTPGFITMYMCRETIRRAVLQKFEEKKGWVCSDLDALYDHIEDRDEANSIVNELKICDPAVGSGHFLVSALNEIIAVKNDLRILQDRGGRRLKEYRCEVVNDELIVTDEEGELFEYNPKSRESQRVQEALFHEKQTLIENCLYGVDINPNSVKICQLRLWIELLKHAYYKTPTELETLPNIDINIKCGNSLISRFDLDADLSRALKKSKFSMDSYRLAVATYRNAANKEEKREMMKLIPKIKEDFRTEINLSDPKVKKLAKLRGEVFNLSHTGGLLFEEDEKTKASRRKKLDKLNTQLEKVEAEIEEIKNNQIYENAFEWRFEFPEVLDDYGHFVGFDVVIGNPPYVGLNTILDQSKELAKLNYSTFDKGGDLYLLFCERGFNILKEEGEMAFIIPNKWMTGRYGRKFREFFITEANINRIINFERVLVFAEAVVFVCIIEATKKTFDNSIEAVSIPDKQALDSFEYFFNKNKVKLTELSSTSWNIVPQRVLDINKKIESKGVPIKEWNGLSFYRGITTGLNKAFHIDQKEKESIVEIDAKSNDIIYQLLRGRDIKRYMYDYSNLYIIFTQRDSIEIDQYPGIKNHLKKYKQELIPKVRRSDKIGRKPGAYKWYEIQDNTAYFSEFSKEKIVWLEISDKANFTYENTGKILTNSAYFITGHSIKYLLAVLNSKLCDFYFFQNTAVIAGGRKRYTKQYVELNPIPILPEAEQKPFIDIVDRILSIKKHNPTGDTSALEGEIDRMVYELYELTEEEIAIVESS